MKKLKKLNAIFLAMTLLLSMLSVPGGNAQAAGKVKVKKITAVDSLTGSKTIYLAKGKKATLKTTVTVTPDKAANKKVTYKSSNTKIATVNNRGVITGKNTGTAKVTVTSKLNSGKKANVTVKIIKGKVTSIKLNETSGTLTVGDSTKLTATVKTGKGGKKNVVWITSDKKIATVKNGLVKAVGVGTATITVKAADGTGKKATYKVTVKEKSTTTENSSTTETTTTENSNTTETTTTENSNTTEKPTTEAPTENPTTETTEVTLQNTEGKNAQDVAVLKKIIQEQISKGAEVSTYLNCDEYTWNESGQLTSIVWNERNLQGSISLEGLTVLTQFFCRDNELSSLNVAKNTFLTVLYCDDNKLTSLDVTKNTFLTYLDCSDNPLKNLNLSNNTALIDLRCAHNQLTSLDVSKNTLLTYLTCCNNQLSSLDMTNSLTYLDCSGNRLTSLDVSKNTSLYSLACYNNSITSLDVTKNTSLTFLYCDNTVKIIGSVPSIEYIQ